jgi:hypothetical protein
MDTVVPRVCGRPVRRRVCPVSLGFLVNELVLRDDHRHLYFWFLQHSHDDPLNRGLHRGSKPHHLSSVHIIINESSRPLVSALTSEVAVGDVLDGQSECRSRAHARATISRSQFSSGASSQHLRGNFV